MGTRCTKGSGTAGAAAAPARGGQYRPRRPRASPLWQCVERHAKELHAAGRSRRAVEARVIERFIECGDPHYGFARIYCDACGHDTLLAYSCKTRYFCPSCHQKRVLLYADWVEENVLAPVARRQYVFTVPKLLRPAFGRQRAWLGELCRLAARLLVEAYAEALTGARPGLIRFVQTFGDLANFNPHVHVLAADGAFLPDGTLVPLPAVPEGLLVEGFRRAVLEFLVQHAAISGELRFKLLGWRYSGFSAHNQVRVTAGDPEGRKKLAGTRLRAPMSLEKMRYDAETGTVIYRSKMHLGLSARSTKPIPARMSEVPRPDARHRADQRSARGAAHPRALGPLATPGDGALATGALRRLATEQRPANDVSPRPRHRVAKARGPRLASRWHRALCGHHIQPECGVSRGFGVARIVDRAYQAQTVLELDAVRTAFGS